MSYVRFAWEGSDVYVFESVRGLECCGCRLQDLGFCCDEPEDMIAHLAAHRRAGQFVPDSAVLALWNDIPGALRPRRREPPSLTYSTLQMDIARLRFEADHFKKLADAADPPTTKKSRATQKTRKRGAR